MTVRTLKAARTPQYADPQNRTVRLIVEFEELLHLGELPFLATPDDIEPHGREILQRALDGEFGEIAAFAPTN